MPTGSEWREDDAGRHGLGRGGRGNIDNYSPVASAFPASSMANSGLPSPHGLPQHSQGAHGYGNTAGGYALYGSPDDVSYNDGRPHSSSGESNSPAYGYSNLSSSANAGDLHAQHAAYAAATGVDPASKTYSFVSLPGNTVRKRPRRRYDEIERLYACNYPGCTKSYGTLNHLNAHVNMQKHGVKRHPNGKLMCFLIFCLIIIFVPIGLNECPDASHCDLAINAQREVRSGYLLPTLPRFPAYPFLCFSLFLNSLIFYDFSIGL